MSGVGGGGVVENTEINSSKPVLYLIKISKNRRGYFRRGKGDFWRKKNVQLCSDVQ